MKYPNYIVHGHVNIKITSHYERQSNSKSLKPKVKSKVMSPKHHNENAVV